MEVVRNILAVIGAVAVVALIVGGGLYLWVCHDFNAMAGK